MLTHIAGKQLAKSLKIISIQHSNTVKSKHYNIFIKDSIVVFIMQYYKGYSVSSNVKIIHQYLLRKVGKLLVYYIQLVLLFQQWLEAIVQEKEVISSHMQLVDLSSCKQTSNQFKEALKRKSRIKLELELTIPAYCKIAISISQRFLRRSTAFQADKGDKNKEQNKENTQSAIADMQAGHTVHITGIIYTQGIIKQAGAVAEKKQQFYILSTDQHQFLRF